MKKVMRGSYTNEPKVLKHNSDSFVNKGNSERRFHCTFAECIFRLDKEWREYAKKKIKSLGQHLDQGLELRIPRTDKVSVKPLGSIEFAFRDGGYIIDYPDKYKKRVRKLRRDIFNKHLDALIEISKTPTEATDAKYGIKKFSLNGGTYRGCYQYKIDEFYRILYRVDTGNKIVYVIDVEYKKIPLKTKPLKKLILE